MSKLDRLVAERVMGWRQGSYDTKGAEYPALEFKDFVVRPDGGPVEIFDGTIDCRIMTCDWSPSSNIADSMGVFQALRKNYPHVRIDVDSHFHLRASTEGFDPMDCAEGEWVDGHGGRLEVAICWAALRAKGVSEGEIQEALK